MPFGGPVPESEGAAETAAEAAAAAAEAEPEAEQLTRSPPWPPWPPCAPRARPVWAAGARVRIRPVVRKGFV